MFLWLYKVHVQTEYWLYITSHGHKMVLHCKLVEHSKINRMECNFYVQPFSLSVAVIEYLDVMFRQAWANWRVPRGKQLCTVQQRISQA